MGGAWLAEVEAFRVLAVAARFAVYLTALGAAGLAIVALVFGTRMRGPELAHLLGALAAWAAGGALALLLWFATQVGLASGGDILDAEIWGLLLGLPPGHASGLALVGLAILAVARGGCLPLGIGALLVCGSFTLSGHSAGTVLWPLAAILLTLHLLAAAYWLGGLWALRRAVLTQPATEAAALVVAWARGASWMVAALLAAGIGLAWLILGDLAAVFGTSYGAALLAKTALVGALLGFAAWHRLRLTPALRAGDAAAPARLGRSIEREALVMALVLLAAATLTATSPSNRP